MVRRQTIPGAGGRPPLPASFGIALDAATRRLDGGSVLVGGCPLAVLRLSQAGARLLDDLVGGAPVPAAAAANALARRLLDLGMAHPRPPLASDRPPGTVVIPVRDDAPGLAATLAAVGRVDGGDRVVVVDDGSTDAGAVRRAVAAGPDPDAVHLIRLEHAGGPAGARQAGWEAATTEIVAFVDAGCVPEAGWLDRLVAHLADPAVAAVAPRIRAREVAGAPPWLVAYEEARSPLDLGAAAAIVRPGSPVPYVPTAVLVVRRAARAAVGGFDPGLRFGEDVDLVWRLARDGWTVRYEPAAEASHPVRPSLAALLRQRFHYGCSAAPLAARHGPAVAPLTVSLWSAAAWGLAVLGHPVLGAGVAGASTAVLVPRLSSLHHPVAEAVRLAGGGHLRAGRLLAEAGRRSWWPLVALAAVVWPRARRVAVAAAVPVLDRRLPPTLAVPRWLALRALDDLAYGSGVWAGAARARSAAALRPHLSGWPGWRPHQPCPASPVDEPG